MIERRTPTILVAVDLDQFAEALPNISTVPEPGHTLGHSAWLIASGGGSLFILGEIVHMPGVQFARTDSAMRSDVDCAAAIETRKHIMNMIATDRLMVAGMHPDFPCFGHDARHQQLRVYPRCVDPRPSDQSRRRRVPLTSVQSQVALCAGMIAAGVECDPNQMVIGRNPGIAVRNLGLT